MELLVDGSCAGVVGVERAEGVCVLECPWKGFENGGRGNVMIGVIDGKGFVGVWTGSDGE